MLRNYTAVPMGVLYALNLESCSLRAGSDEEAFEAAAEHFGPGTPFILKEARRYVSVSTAPTAAPTTACRSALLPA